MKVYSIGREAGCDIVIHDSTDVISRRHAVLSVTSSGKMTITDQSHNGTYVNGIRITPNVPVPVTRKDNVSFAHVARLDWNRVPKSNGTILAYVIGGVAALLVIIALAVGAYFLFSGSDDPTPPVYNPPTENELVKSDSDSIDNAKKKAEELMKEEQRKQDSIRQHIEDSIKKAMEKPQPPRTDVKRGNSGSTKKEGNGNTTKPETGGKDKPKVDDKTNDKEQSTNRVRGF